MSNNTPGPPNEAEIPKRKPEESDYSPLTSLVTEQQEIQNNNIPRS